ncbi:MAG TPA: hypothetical protein VGF67_04830 [Ktedonobacteraceae bacterium]
MQSQLALRQEIQKQQKNFRRVTRETLPYAYMLLSKEIDIGAGQCARLTQAFGQIEESLRHFSGLFDPPDSLPPSVQVHRHPLLLILESTSALLHEVQLNLTSLHQTPGSSPGSRIALRRNEILRQLEKLNLKRDAIDHSIERLLFECAPERGLPRNAEQERAQREETSPNC